MKETILKYYEIIRNAVDGKDWKFEQLPFSDDICVIGPNERFNGIAVVKEMYPQFLKIIKDFKIKDLFFSENSACGIVEYTPINHAPPILTAEWFQIKNKKIATLFPIYDVGA